MPSPSESAGYLHRVQLIDAWLTTITFSDNPRYDPARGGDIGFSVESETAVDLLHPNGPQTSLRVVVLWHGSGQLPPEGPFTLELVVTGQFVKDPERDQERLRKWLDFNSQFLLWPYARSYAAALTSFSRHLPLTLFTLQLPRPRAFEPETGDFGVIQPDHPAG